MTSQTSGSATKALGARESVRPGIARGSTPPPEVPKRPLRFLVQREPAYSGLWSSLKALCTPTKSLASNSSTYLFRGARVARFELASRSITTSFLLHFSIVFLLIYLPQALPAEATRFETASSQSRKIYYRVPLLNSSRTLPRIAPAGPGARPGSGSLPSRLPALGSTALHSHLTAVSRPLRPDNYRQTILQLSSPPDLRITNELKLPNIVLGKPLDMPKAPLRFRPDAARPTRPDAQTDPETAPAPDVASIKTLATPFVSFLEPTNAQPRLPMPSPAAPVARRQGRGEVTEPGDPVIATPGAGDSSSLVVIGVDPAGPASQVLLPPGNRYGEFSISPAGGQPGSPGGSPGGVIGGGNSGNGTGGDGSTGLGPGGGGGGGGNSGSPGTLSVSGGGSKVEGEGTLGPSGVPLSMVYAVPAALNLRKNALVVSAGPMGGGGLDAYGALPCGKIYTIFLPMPGKSWTLQYCQQADPGPATTATNSRSPVVHLQRGLVPPDVESRFDFRRLPVPAAKARKMIVLKGTLREDGTVANLQIYQGIVHDMDEAARIAFSRWKFKPAMREGKAVSVEILVGIPPELPVAH